MGRESSSKSLSESLAMSVFGEVAIPFSSIEALKFLEIKSADFK